MTNPFLEKSPAELKLLVQGTAVCEECSGAGFVTIPYYAARNTCPTCNGTSKQPSLSDADLDALAACLCDGQWIQMNEHIRHWVEWHLELVNVENGWLAPVPFTTDPREAMRLQVKYNLGVSPFDAIGATFTKGWGICAQFKEDTTEARCRALTGAAVLAELTKREEGAEEPVKISKAPPTNITGGMDSVEYVRRMREGEEGFEYAGD